MAGSSPGMTARGGEVEAAPPSAPLLLPPQLLEAGVAAAAPAVIGVFRRVLEVVVLVVVLGDPEVRGRLDRDDDRLLEAARGGKRRLRGLGQAALLLVMDEDRRPVGLAL